MTRQFTTATAKRAQVNLIIGLCGPSSSGKTYSALELATGIQSVTGGDIELIDTEHERALFYADKFKFNHTPFHAPFASLDYLDAVRQAAARAKIVIVDSMSHEHESEGGMIDYQEAELTRMAGADYGKRQAMQMLAWAKPKAARRKLLQGLTQVDAHLILCFRAKNTSKPGKDDRGKSIVIPMGFMPIAGEEFVFEAALSAMLPPNSKGVPNWNPDMPGEKIAVKLPSQFDWLADEHRALSRHDGQRLAEWARGGAKPATAQPEPPRERLAKDTVPDFGPDDLAAWADNFEFEIDGAEGGYLTVKDAFGARKAQPEWVALKAWSVGRAKELHDKSEVKWKSLRDASKVTA